MVVNAPPDPRSVLRADKVYAQRTLQVRPCSTATRARPFSLADDTKACPCTLFSSRLRSALERVQDALSRALPSGPLSHQPSAPIFGMAFTIDTLLVIASTR